MKKGQIFSTELVLASAVFITALVVFVSSWNSMLQSYFDEEADLELQTSVLGISDMMALSPGEPSNWEAGVLDNASAFGLASEPNVISGAKFAALQSLNRTDYDAIKERMGAGRFGVYMELNNSSTRVYSFGVLANSNDSTVKSFTANRLVLLNDSVFTLRVQAWRTRSRVA